MGFSGELCGGDARSKIPGDAKMQRTSCSGVTCPEILVPSVVVSGQRCGTPRLCSQNAPTLVQLQRSPKTQRAILKPPPPRHPPAPHAAIHPHDRDTQMQTPSPSGPHPSANRRTFCQRLWPQLEPRVAEGCGCPDHRDCTAKRGSMPCWDQVRLPYRTRASASDYHTISPPRPPP